MKLKKSKKDPKILLQDCPQQRPCRNTKDAIEEYFLYPAVIALILRHITHTEKPVSHFLLVKPRIGTTDVRKEKSIETFSGAICVMVWLPPWLRSTYTEIVDRILCQYHKYRKET